jgi:hypothetical protein
MGPLGGAAQRLVIALVAVVAVVSMHGASAAAHACPSNAEEHPAVVGSDHIGHGHHDDVPGEPNHEDGGSRPGSHTASHCSTPACGAIVLEPSAPHGTVARVASPVIEAPDSPPSAASASPDPPVPRSLLHV